MYIRTQNNKLINLYRITDIHASTYYGNTAVYADDYTLCEVKNESTSRLVLDMISEAIEDGDRILDLRGVI